jgi:2-desacetyl-2-hydroxyethyl bacteriochlorophyllide A dehydrogenase
MNRTYPMAMIFEPGRVEYRDETIAEPGPTQILIRTRAVSICGSDAHTFHGKHPFAPLPAAPGHELAGEVVELGSGVERIQVGDRVCLEPVIVCRGCEFCERGDYHLCRNISFHHRQGRGAFTPFFVAEQAWVHKLPKNISFEEGALVEPLAVAIHAVGRAELKMGQTVAVFGAGAIGLLVVMVAKSAGAGDVFSVDVQEPRLDQARALGVREGFNNLKSDPVEEIINVTDGLGVDAVFEAAGLSWTLNQALASLKKGGVGVMIGLISGGEVALPANIFVAKEITLRGSQGYCRDFQTALKLLENAGLDLSPLITHTLPPERLQEGFELLDDPSAGAVKVVIKYD